MAQWDYPESVGWCLCQDNANASHTLFHFIFLVPDDSWYSGLALSFEIRSKVNGRGDMTASCFKKIIAWKYRNNWIWPNRWTGVLPGKHSKAHFSHKSGENMAWIGSLSFYTLWPLYIDFLVFVFYFSDKCYTSGLGKGAWDSNIFHFYGFRGNCTWSWIYLTVMVGAALFYYLVVLHWCYLIFFLSSCVNLAGI